MPSFAADAVASPRSTRAAYRALGIDDCGRIAGFYLNPNFTPRRDKVATGAPMDALLPKKARSRRGEVSETDHERGTDSDLPA